MRRNEAGPAGDQDVVRRVGRRAFRAAVYIWHLCAGSGHPEQWSGERTSLPRAGRGGASGGEAFAVIWILPKEPATSPLGSTARSSAKLWGN
eukprot:scaffold907_cov247-Pinguiococcus_pyrenoidosus.AAC.2